MIDHDRDLAQRPCGEAALVEDDVDVALAEVAASVHIQKDIDNDGVSTYRVFTDANTIEQMRMNDGDEAATLIDGAVTANG